MQVEIRKQTERNAVLAIRGVNHAFVNALRRTLIANVPKLAIEDVTIYDNTSALFDEMLAHRLGLLPVPTDIQAFNFRDECPGCEGEGCSSCTVLYTLSKEGPGVVYSGDLTPTDSAFAIPDPEIPVVKLLEGQRVMLEAAAIMGVGRTHAKWATVNAAGYRELPRVKVNNGAIPENERAEFKRVLNPQAFTMDDSGKLTVVDEEKAYDFTVAARDRFSLEFVETSLEEDAFLFRVETDGAVTAKDAIIHAVHLLMDRLKQVEEDAPKLAKAA